MNETELERMMVRIMGDPSSYIRAMNQSSTATVDFSKLVAASAQQLASLGTSIQGFANTAAGALASTGILRWLNSARTNFEGMELSIMKLTAAMEQNGGEVKERLADYNAFGKAIANVTTTSIPEVRTLLRKAEAYGLFGDVAKAVVKNSIALAAVNDGQPARYLAVAAALAQGNVQMLRRLPGLRGVKDETELLAKAQKMLETGFKLAEVQGKTNQASIRRLWLTFTELNLEIGKTLSESLKPLIEWLQLAADWFKELDPEVKKIIVTVGVLVVQSMAFTAALGLLRPALAFFSPVAILVSLLGYAIFKAAGHVQLFEINTTAMRALAVDAWNAINRAVQIVAGFVADHVIPVLRIALNIAKFLGVALLDAFDAIASVAPDIWNAITAAAKATWQVILNVAAVVGDFLYQIRAALPLTVLLTAVVLAGVVAYKILATTVGFAIAAYTALHVTQVASFAMWITWRALILTVNAALILFSATHRAAALIAIATWATQNVLIALNAVLVGAWTAAVAIAQAATWTWNAALGVLNTLLSPVALLGFIAVVAVLGAALLAIGSVVAVIAGAFMGAWSAAEALVDVFLKFPTAAGPLGAIGNIFKEWGDILKDVWRAMQVDSALAWEIFKAAGMLAFNQLRDLWPPLWDFIQKGFARLWQMVSDIFQDKMELAAKIAINERTKLADPLGLSKIGERLDEQTKKDTEASARNTKFYVNSAIHDLNRLSEQIKVTETTRTIESRKALDKLRAQIPEKEAEAFAKSFAGPTLDQLTEMEATFTAKQMAQKREAEKNALETGTGIGESMKKGFRQQNFHAALMDSAEALSRLQEFKDRLEQKGGAKVNPDGKRFDASDVGGAEAAGRKENWEEKNNIALNKLVELAKKDQENTEGTVEITPADFDD